VKPTPVNMRNCPIWYACQSITGKKNDFVEMRGPQIRLCLFTCWLIASKQLNSLTTIVNLSRLGGAEIKHLLLVREAPGSIPSSDMGFYVWLFALLLLCFYIFCPKTHNLLQNFAKSFAIFIFLVYLTYCKICDRFIMV